MDTLKNSDYLAIVNSTCRSTGAVGRMALVPRVVPAFARKSDKILDFGAGKNAVHTMNLRAEGYNVTAYEIGNNFDPIYHDSKALNRKYDVVYASNVLNVQPNRDYLDRVLTTITKVLKKDGKFIANYPADPRKCKGLGAADLHAILERHFRDVQRVKQTPDVRKINTPVWVCTK